MEAFRTEGFEPIWLAPRPGSMAADLAAMAGDASVASVCERRADGWYVITHVSSESVLDGGRWDSSRTLREDLNELARRLGLSDG